MLSSFRKFSSSIYSKVFLFIVAIPFIFWGMGDLFNSGNLNTIAKIGNDKISSREFVNFIRNSNQRTDVLNNQAIESLLYSFVGQKLLEKEVEKFDIKLSEQSLALMIKNEQIFSKNNKFSRTEYEKFLLNNNVNAVIYERYISNQEKKKQLLDFIGGGIIPSEIMINIAYNKIKQERDVKLININKILKEKTKYNKNEIERFYEDNKKSFQDVHKTIKYTELKPKVLIGKDEFNSLFFEKIDELDDLIVEGKNLNHLIKEYNLNEIKEIIFNKNGENITSENPDKNFAKILKKINNINESEPTVLIENENIFFLVELVKSENIQQEMTDISVINKITSELNMSYKRKTISELISKVRAENFKKENFYSFAKKEKATIESINIKSLNDDTNIQLDIVGQIYLAPENNVIVVSDIALSEVYLVYIENVKNKSINKNSKDYDKFYNLAKTSTTSSLYNSYDKYLKNKYEIDINYKALEQINNSF